MQSDPQEILRRAAASPQSPLNYEGILGRAKRLRRARFIVVASSCLALASGGWVVAAGSGSDSIQPPVVSGPTASTSQTPDPKSSLNGEPGNSGFSPSTYPEDGSLVMPLEFVDGTTSELIFSPELGLDRLVLSVFTAGGLGTIDRSIYISYGDGSNFMSEGPFETFEGHDGDKVEVWEGAEDAYPGRNLVFRFGNWFVAAPIENDPKLDDGAMTQWARYLIGHQSPAGFLILEERGTLQLKEPRSNAGHSLMLHGGREGPTVQLFPGPCQPPVKSETDPDVQVMDDGTIVSFTHIEGSDNEFLATWCEDGTMLVQVEDATEVFAKSAAKGIRARGTESPSG